MTKKKTENTVINTVENKPWQFQPGQSGNPAGKPKGTRNRATHALNVMLDGEAEALTRKAIEMALNGDTTALKLCLDRIAPTLKSISPPIHLDLPHADNLTDTARNFVCAAAEGKISPDSALKMVSAISSIARIEEIENLKHRLEALEQAIEE